MFRLVWGQAQRGGTQAHYPTFLFPTHLPISYHTHVYPRGGVAAATARRQPGVRGLVGAPGRARGGRLPNWATSAWLPKKVPSAGRLPYLVTCLPSRRLGLIYSYSSPVQRAQPTAPCRRLTHSVVRAYSPTGVIASGVRVTVLFLFLGGTFPIRYVSYCISMYLECILMCILMCPVHIHQDTSRYIKIHLYLSLWLLEMYLTLGYVSFFTVHLGHI